LSQLDARLGLLKKSVARLADQEFTTGLSSVVQQRLAIYEPRLRVIEGEAADIANQMSILMGKMNRLQELSTRLSPLLRMAVAMNDAIEDLVPSMVVLKKLGKALASAKSHQPQQGSRTEQVNRVLSDLSLPMDALIQLEYQLQREVSSYIEPILEPLQDLTDHVKGSLPDTHELHGLESTLLAQHNRFNMLLRLSTELFDGLNNLLHEQRLSSPQP
jgi:hypothetical protein